MTLEKAVRKLTGQAADNMGLVDRGYIRPGCFADLVLFNPAMVADKGTFVDPCQYPDGITMVTVNGRIAWMNGEETLRGRYGRVLYRK